MSAVPEARAATMQFAAALVTTPATTDAAAAKPAEHNELHSLADGRSFAVPAAPEAAFANASEFTTQVRAVVETLQHFVCEAHSVGADRMLSEEGRENRLAPKAAEAIAALVTSYKSLETRAVAFNAKRDALYALPELKPNDAVGQLADSEARQWWNGLSAKQRAKWLPKLSAGEQPRLALAIMRSPWPMGDAAKIATQGWHAHIEHEYVGELIDLDAQQRMLEWSQGIVSRAAQKLVDTRGMSPGRVGAILRDKQAENAGPFKIAYRTHR